VKAVVRILVPKRTMTLSEHHTEQNRENEEGESHASPDRKGEEEKKGEAVAEAAADEAKEKSVAEGRSTQGVSRLSRVPSEKIIE
jgi:hypothetical protein